MWFQRILECILHDRKWRSAVFPWDLLCVFHTHRSTTLARAPFQGHLSASLSLIDSHLVVQRCSMSRKWWWVLHLFSLLLSALNQPIQILYSTLPWHPPRGLRKCNSFYPLETYLERPGDLWYLNFYIETAWLMPWEDLFGDGGGLIKNHLLGWTSLALGTPSSCLQLHVSECTLLRAFCTGKMPSVHVRGSWKHCSL